MEIKKVPIDKVENWEKNPRGLKKEDFKRLKKQIEKLGVYKPMVAYRKNGKYVVLGGNMRLRALKDLGIKEVDLSIVKVKDEAEKLEYSLSDNDRVGYYEEDALVELLYNNKGDIDLGAFNVDLGSPTNTGTLLDRETKETVEPDIEFSEELHEEHNYVVVYFDNKIDWLNFLSHFDIKTVRGHGNYNKGERKGIGRVIKGEDFLKKVTIEN